MSRWEWEYTPWGGAWTDEEDAYSLFDYKPAKPSWIRDECYPIWDMPVFSQTRYRPPWRFLPGRQAMAVRRATNLEMLEALMATMPCVVDVPADEFEEKLDDGLTWDDVADEDFWVWSGFYDVASESYIFTFKDSSDAMKFTLYLSGFSQAIEA